jgi:predicted DNA-binding transcriptional regulator YafY
MAGTALRGRLTWQVAKVAAVADAFGVDKRTAHRYIAAAREKGLMK